MDVRVALGRILRKSPAPQDGPLCRITTQCRRWSDDFRAELEEEIRRLGGDPSTRGSISGSLRRGWMSVRSAVGGGSDDGVVVAAERGEDSAREDYETALGRDLPPAIRTMVERQCGRIREAHDRVRSLRERAA